MLFLFIGSEFGSNAFTQVPCGFHYFGCLLHTFYSIPYLKNSVDNVQIVFFRLKDKLGTLMKPKELYKHTTNSTKKPFFESVDFFSLFSTLHTKYVDGHWGVNRFVTFLLQLNRKSLLMSFHLSFGSFFNHSNVF